MLLTYTSKEGKNIYIAQSVSYILLSWPGSPMSQDINSYGIALVCCKLRSHHHKDKQLLHFWSDEDGGHTTED